MAKDTPQNPSPLTQTERRFVFNLVAMQTKAAIREICIRRYGDSFNSNYPEKIEPLVREALHGYFKPLGPKAEQ